MLIVGVKEVHEPMHSYRIAGVNNIQVILACKLLPGGVDSKKSKIDWTLSLSIHLITWDFSCLVRTKDLENAFPQNRHLNGFSPV